ncbi:hypothetical protein GF312_07720 [Candidatus Poribacteria bacterium]|nr:hypothetical protein [Candidatus Poribacteria bacterium]
MYKLVFAMSFMILTFFMMTSGEVLAIGSLSLSLDECVDMALKNNEEILKAKQDISEAEGRLTAVRSDEYLQVDFTSWHDRIKNENDYETKSYNGTIHAEQRLARFGEVPGNIDAAQEQLRIALLGLESAKINVVSQTRSTFYIILLIQDEIKERLVLRDEIEKKRARTEERVEGKLALELDLLDVELELAQQELRINELNRELRVRKAELLQIIGADEESALLITGDFTDEEYYLDECIKLAMDNRVELQDLRGQLERQKRLLGEVWWEFLPELRALYKYKDASIRLEQQNRTWDTILAYDKDIWSKEGGAVPGKNKWELSFGLSFPIFDGYRIKGIMDEEKARLEKLIIEIRQMEKSIRLEVRNTFEEVANQKENMNILEKVVILRRKTLERMEAIMETPVISQKYPRLAGITFDDVIRAREDYTEAQRSYFAQKRSYMMERENLRRIMGITR